MAGGTICAHIGCDQPGEHRCGRCRSVFYCSEKHQRLHWKEGGHTRHCTPAPTPASAPTAAAAVALSGPTTYLGVTVGAASANLLQSPPAGPKKVCGACRVPKLAAAFSKSQLKKKAKRRCLGCFEAGKPVAEAGIDPVNP